jgi:hypothetical protein
MAPDLVGVGCGVMVAAQGLVSALLSMRAPGGKVFGGLLGRSAIDEGRPEPLAADGVAVYDCCSTTAFPVLDRPAQNSHDSDGATATR